MLISQKLSFFSLSEILPPTSKGMQKYNKYVYSRQSSIGTIASVESSTWNKFPLKCKQTTSNSAWVSSSPPSILPSSLPFFLLPAPLPTPPPHPQPLRFLHFCPPSCVEQIDYEARRQRGKKKKKKSKELPKGNVTETGRKGKHWERKDGRKKRKRVSDFVLFQPGKMHHYTLGRDTDSDKESPMTKDVLNEPLPCAKSYAEKDRNSKHSFHQLNTLPLIFTSGVYGIVNLNRFITFNYTWHCFLSVGKMVTVC